MIIKIFNFQFSIFNSKGFTFIELILYISIVTIMLTAIIPFAWNIIGGSVKSSTQQEVSSAARFVSERLKYEIRNAQDIDSANSNFDTNLANDSNQKLALIISLSPLITNYICVSTDGQILIDTSSPPCSGNPLNSTDIKVTDLTFTNYTSADNKTKHVGFILTATANFPSQRHEFQETITLRSSAEVRNN